MLNVDQSQRRDIDTTLDDRLTLAIDEENIADNPYIFEPTSFVGNNWFKQGSNIVKLNLAEQDSLIFLSSPLTKLLQKDITNVIVSFDYSISNVSVNYPILSNISLTCMEMTNYMLVENILTTQGHIDVDCSLFNFSSNVVNTSISEQGFKVGINFNGNKSNATIKLSNVKIQFKYNNKLLQQSDSVINRLEPYVDFYRDEDGDLVLQIGGDASGKGIDHSGGDIDTYSKTEIDNKLATKVNVEIGKGLSSNDYTLTEKTKLGTIETNANYYVHPSSHQTGMIVESSALTNLETSENATQHEINLAIDSKINSGGGSVDWSDIENKPSDYPPSSHNHDDRYYTESEIDTALNSKADVNSLSTVATTGDYDDLIDKPIIPSKTSDIVNDSGFITSSSLPTKVSDLQNDTGFITSSALPTKTSDLTNDGDGTNAFLTQHQSLTNYIQKSSTSGLVKNDGTVDTTSYSTFSGSYNDLSNKPIIPTKISDLTNDSDFIEKSNTSGLVKNDGTIDTSTYLTSSALSNYVQKSSTNGLLKNDGTVDTTSYSTFSGSYSDLSNKPSIPSSSSDLSDGSDLVKKSSTNGLLKNDGSVDTNAYITSSALPTIQTSWGSITSDSKVASEKLIKSSLDGKLDNTIGSSAVTIASDDNIVITDTSDSNKVKKVANLLASQVKDSTAHSNIGSSANATQSSINSSIDTAFDTKLFKYYYAPNDFITPNRWYTDYDHCYPNLESGNLIFTTDCEYRFVFSEYPYKVRENFSIGFKYKASASNQYTTLKINGTTIVQNTTTENDIEITSTNGNAIVTNHTTNQTWDLQGNLERIDLLVRTGTASIYDYTYSSDDSFEKQVPSEEVIEETALSNIGTSKGATQSEINSAIDYAISQGGGGSGGGSYLNDFYGDATNNELVIDYTNTTGSDIVTSWSSTTSDTKVPSEKLTKDTLDNKVDKSSTTGLLKNDGSIMTGGTGSTNYAIGNHTHSGYANSTHTHNYGDLNNVSVVNVTVTYSDNTTGTIKLLQYTGS